MQLNSYLEQHENVRKEVLEIDNLIAKSNLDENAFDIATHISRLAGILKIHLSTEDQYLYPNLEKSDDEKIRNLSKAYQKEMGDLHFEFQQFKDKYNTKSKLTAGEDEFALEWKRIVTALENRMTKEEQGIYQYV